MTAQRDTVLKVLDGVGQMRVLVVGDLMLDRYVLGEVDRISPEAPVPVLKHAHRYERPGGAANVAMNLAGLGCETFLAGFWGHDGEQAELARLLEAARIDTAGVVTSSAPTTSKTRFVARSQHLMRLDIEADGPPVAEESARVEARAVELVKKVHAVVLVDRGKGVLTDAVTAAVLRAARAAGIPAVVDPQGRDFSKYSGASQLCPTLQELERSTGVSGEDPERLLAVARVQMQEHDIRCLAVLMQETGLRLMGAEGDVMVLCHAGEVFDVAGVDDTAIAVLAVSLAGGLPAQLGGKLAAAAMAVVLGKIGAVPVTRAELLAELEHDRAREANQDGTGSEGTGLYAEV